MPRRNLTFPVAVDPTRVVNGSYLFDNGEVMDFDAQILALETFVLANQNRGQVTATMTLDAGSATTAVGDLLCLASSSAAVSVTRATATPLTAAGNLICAIALQAIAPGLPILVALPGSLIPPAITGLTTGPKYVTANTTTARYAVAASYSGTDVVVGITDTANNLAFEPIAKGVAGGGGGTLAGDATGSAGANTIVNLTGSAGVVTVTSGTAIAMGTTPASTGLIRLPNNTLGLSFHDNAAGYIGGISLDAFNELIIGGDVAQAHAPAAIILNHVSAGHLYVAFGTTTCLDISSGLTTTIQVYRTDVPALIQQRTQVSDSATNDMTMQAQSAFASASTNINGAFVALQGGAAKTNGSSGRRGGVRLQVGADSAETLVEVTEPVLGNRVVALCQIGSGISSTQMPANTGDGVVYIANRAIVPSASAVGGGILYAEAGALKWRGSGGTITTVANA